MLRASLDDIGGGDNYEQLWTKRVGEDRFEICCIPFFVYDLALGDVVRADARTGYVIRSVEQRSGNGVVRIAVKRRDDMDAIHLRLHDLLESWSTCTSGSRQVTWLSAWSREDPTMSSSRAWPRWVM